MLFHVPNGNLQATFIASDDENQKLNKEAWNKTITIGTNLYRYAGEFCDFSNFQ